MSFRGLHAEHASSSSLFLCGFALHLLRYLHIHLEELSDTSIKTNALGLIEIGFSIVGWYAFLEAR